MKGKKRAVIAMERQNIGIGVWGRYFLRMRSRPTEFQVCGKNPGLADTQEVQEGKSCIFARASEWIASLVDKSLQAKDEEETYRMPGPAWESA